MNEEETRTHSKTNRINRTDKSTHKTRRRNGEEENRTNKEEKRAVEDSSRNSREMEAHGSVEHGHEHVPHDVHHALVTSAVRHHVRANLHTTRTQQGQHEKTDTT